jgi:hypothetical protein
MSCIHPLADRKLSSAALGDTKNNAFARLVHLLHSLCEGLILGKISAR